jgi:hypothetical protein
VNLYYGASIGALLYYLGIPSRIGENWKCRLGQGQPRKRFGSIYMCCGNLVQFAYAVAHPGIIVIGELYHAFTVLKL